MGNASVSSGVSLRVFSRVKIGPWVRRDLWERFKIAARALDRDAQDLLNEAMEEWLRRHSREIAEKAKQLGIMFLDEDSLG